MLVDGSNSLGTSNEKTTYIWIMGNEIFKFLFNLQR